MRYLKPGTRVLTGHNRLAVVGETQDAVQYADTGSWDSLSNRNIWDGLLAEGDKIQEAYPRLPVGSVVLDEATDDDVVQSVPVMKTGEDEWTNQGWPGVFTNAEMAVDVRTLTRLGDGVADVEIVEPERDFFCCAAPSHIHGRIVMPTGERVETTLTVPPATADVEPAPEKATGNSDGPHLHFEVEPEPLKTGDVVLVWAKVRSAKVDHDGEIKIALHRADGQSEETFSLPDGIVRPAAGQVPPPWLERIRVLTDDERDRIMLAYRDGVLAPGEAVLVEVEDIIRERTKGGAS